MNEARLGWVMSAAALLASCAATSPTEVNSPPEVVTVPNYESSYPPAPPIRTIPTTPASEPTAPFPPEPWGLGRARNGFAKCASCHSLIPGRNGIGPSLAGVYGRHAASAPNFRYSEALAGSGLVWDAAKLDRFLTRPRDVVPGNKMTFSGLSDPAVRAEIIAYIQRY